MSAIRIERLDPSFRRWEELLDLILESFAYMEGRIDPPSSALALTPSGLRDKAGVETAYLALDGNVILGCMFCRPEGDCLYIGKLAVSPSAQGKGVGRKLLHAAEDLAAAKGLAALRLETRVELVDNHAIFSAWGFERTAENAHAGFARTTSVEMRKPVSGRAAPGSAGDGRR